MGKPLSLLPILRRAGPVRRFLSQAVEAALTPARDILFRHGRSGAHSGNTGGIVSTAWRLQGTAALLLAGLMISQPAAAETRTYVVGWFGMATNSTDNDCGPGGPNPGVQLQYRKD
jgi:hypothetical protein